MGVIHPVLGVVADVLGLLDVDGIRVRALRIFVFDEHDLRLGLLHEGANHLLVVLVFVVLLRVRAALKPARRLRVRVHHERLPLDRHEVLVIVLDRVLDLCLVVHLEFLLLLLLGEQRLQPLLLVVPVNDVGEYHEKHDEDDEQNDLVPAQELPLARVDLDDVLLVGVDVLDRGIPEGKEEGVNMRTQKGDRNDFANDNRTKAAIRNISYLTPVLSAYPPHSLTNYILFSLNSLLR